MLPIIISTKFVITWWLTYTQNVHGRKFGGIAVEASFAKGHERFKKSRKHDESDDERVHQFGDALEHDDNSGDDGKETGFPPCNFHSSTNSNTE